MENRKQWKEISKKYFDEEAKGYDNSRDGKFVQCMYNEIVTRVMDLPGKNILELGCGNGNIIRLLERKKAAQYYGADISEEMIHEARKRLSSQVDLRCADVLALPYKDKMFDIIICNASFHHYTEPKKAITEIKRVLSPNGILILGDPTVPGSLLLKLFNWGIQFAKSGDFRIYGKKDITELFHNNGLQIREWKRINYRAFVFNAKIMNI